MGESGQTYTVFIPGYLTVNGTTTTINTEDLNVEDKIITVNFGETGTGVSPAGNGLAGILVDRGLAANDSYLQYDDSIDKWTVDQGNGVQLEILTGALGGGAALLNIVEDTTPQLGGDLDVNSQSIIATTNNDIPLTVTGSGDIILTSANTGNIRFDGPAVISGPAPNSTPAAGDVALYQGTDTGGGTQILFENDTDTGELVSKTKAMVFGLIF